MVKKYGVLNIIVVLVISFASFSVVKAQKTASVKGSAKGTLAADMDCSVKINGGAKLINLKAYSPLDAVLKVGDNNIEATSLDKKSTYRNTITAKSGEKIIVEISFFDDSKFLEYIKTGNVNMVETAIKKNPGLVTNQDGVLLSSPLQIAIENSQPDMVRFFMDNGASYLVPENIYPLHLSVKFASNSKPSKDKPAPDAQLCDYFIGKGCKITEKDESGNTPLHVAVKAGKLEMVELLVKMGADVNAKNDYDETPMKIAEDKGLISIITFLSRNGSVSK